MKEIIKFKYIKSIIAFITLIVGVLIIRNFFIRDSYAKNIEELTHSLTSKGYKVTDIREIKRPKEISILTIPKVERELSIDNLHLSIMIFSNDNTAKVALNSISKDGSKIGHANISWARHPHIYQSGVMIVIYVGDSLKMQWDLKNILGRQDKGSKWWEEPLVSIISLL